MAYFQTSTILSDISSTVNQDPTAPTDGSSEWSLFMQFINRAQREWVEAADWETLKKVNLSAISMPETASMASLGLPADFRKLAGPVIDYSSSLTGGEAWTEILPERQNDMAVDSKYFFVQGDPRDGYNLQWATGGGSMSGATIAIPYYSMPTSLVSSTQYPVVPDAEFLTQRSIAYILEARSDPRYQDMERKAREKLLLMIENANTAKYSPYTNPISIQSTENRWRFRMGRD